mmetsp:Transcript_79511/g.233743  ORF Transcript_79511/g.233743 Transcript_79511/m.233743 type:complete len:219 (+) Transcript_79511:1700-2356(+)
MCFVLSTKVCKLAAALEEGRLHLALLLLHFAQLSLQLLKFCHGARLVLHTCRQLRPQKPKCTGLRFKLRTPSLLLCLCQSKVLCNFDLVVLKLHCGLFTALGNGRKATEKVLCSGPGLCDAAIGQRCCGYESLRFTYTCELLPLAGKARSGLRKRLQLLLKMLAPFRELAHLLTNAAPLRCSLGRSCGNEAAKTVRKDPCSLDSKCFCGSPVKRHACL